MQPTDASPGPPPGGRSPGEAALEDQVRGGYTPWRAIQKLRVRYGCMSLCGWSPPAGVTALSFMLAGAGVGLAGTYGPLVPCTRAIELPIGAVRLAGAGRDIIVCEWAGISDSRRVTVSEPP